MQTAAFTNLPKLSFALPLKCTHHLLHHLDGMAAPSVAHPEGHCCNKGALCAVDVPVTGMLNIKEHLLEEDGGKLAIQRRFEGKVDAEAEPAAGRSRPRRKLPPAFPHPHAVMPLMQSAASG